MDEDQGFRTVWGGISNSIKFAVVKIRKLYPLHIITLTAVGAVFALSWIMKGRFEIKQVAYFISNVLLLQSWIPTKEGYFSFNAVSWYLSAAAFMYFLFPTCLRILKKDWRKAAGLTVGAVSLQIIIALILLNPPAVNFSDNFTKYITYICPLYRAGDFLVGCLAGYFFLTKRKESSRMLPDKVYSMMEVTILFIILLQIVVYTRYPFWEAVRYDLYWLPVDTALIYAFSVNRGFLSKYLSRSRVLAFIGDYSGQAFLIHKMVIEFCAYFIKSKAVLAVVAFAVTMFCAVAYSRLERHCQYIFKKRFEKDQY